jgi:hypothetical protein
MKIEWSKIFNDCKIVSAGIGLNQLLSSKFFGRKFLWLQNHFLRNTFGKKKYQHFFGRKIFLGAKLFP